MDSQNKQTQILADLVRELRQGYGLGASFFRAAAARSGVTDTDMQVIAILESTGEATAGQLANLMGLTTGTFTAILNRLENAGLVRRERDPNDGRKVIVKLATGSDGGQESGPLFSSLGQAWAEMAAQYDDEQKAFLLEFLEHSNALAKQEIVRLREVSADDEGVFSAPLAGLASARLVVASDTLGLYLGAGDTMDALYQARFEGPTPGIKVKEGVVTIRYPRRLWLVGTEKRIAKVTLSTAIPWSVVIKSGGSDISAKLGGLDLYEMEANVAGSMFHLELPEPSRVVPIRLGGSGSAFTVLRPPGVAARVRLKGWGSAGTFDGQTLTGMSSEMRLQSPGFDPAAPHYDIEVDSSGSEITITSG